ncbi:hypothetical protein Tco_0083805 [Tanacetum coccineum]
MLYVRRVTLKPSSYKIRLSASVDTGWTGLFCRPEFVEHSVPGLVSEAWESSDTLLTGMLLFQRKYAYEIIERSHMVGCNPCRTLVYTESKLRADGAHLCD